MIFSYSKSARVLGTEFQKGTWIAPEECTARGSMIRPGKAIFPDGKLRAFRAGIADTFFTIPACARIPVKLGGYTRREYVRGYLSVDEGVLTFHTYKPAEQGGDADPNSLRRRQHA